MAYDLFYFQVGMLFGGLIVEKRLEVIDEVMLIVGDLEVCHNDVVRCVCPTVIVGIVGSVCFTRKVETLKDKLVILLQQRPPL